MPASRQERRWGGRKQEQGGGGTRIIASIPFHSVSLYSVIFPPFFCLFRFVFSHVPFSSDISSVPFDFTFLLYFIHPILSFPFPAIASKTIPFCSTISQDLPRRCFTCTNYNTEETLSNPPTKPLTTSPTRTKRQHAPFVSFHYFSYPGQPTKPNKATRFYQPTSFAHSHSHSRAFSRICART